MDNTIDQLVPKAIQAIEEKMTMSEGTVVETYKGYINSMGPSILQAGLIATLAFCTDLKKTREDTSRTNVLNAIMQIMSPSSNDHLLKYVFSACLADSRRYDREGLLTVTDLDMAKVRAVERQILQIIIAMKLAIKTFRLVEDPKENEAL